jgi:hypothetical protein
MSLLLVDETDGRIVAELETAHEAIQVMARLAQDPEAAHLCLVELRAGGGSLASFNSSTAVRVLP